MRLEYFSMVDTVAELAAADGRIVVHSTVPDESPIFEGHFPGYPLMPGVLLIETMAQTSGFLLLFRLRFQRMPFLAQVREAKMRQFVAPGTVLRVEATLAQDGAGYAVTRAAVIADGRTVASSELMFRTLPFDRADFRAEMLVRARQVGLATDGADA
jgi:3-hydroxyacyl-[acyl-carrier-protein] dehydratase